MRNFLLLLFAFVSIQYSFAQPNSQTNIDCDLPETFSLGTNGYTGCGAALNDFDCDGFGDVDYSVENSVWFKYCNTSGAPLTMDFIVDEVNNDCNVQGSLFIGTSASEAVGAGMVDSYSSNPGGNSDGYTLTGTIPDGECAYLVVDGYAGATCSALTITADCPCMPPIITANASPLSICPGGSATLTASGAGVGGTYAWSGGAGNGSSVTVSPASTTTYTVTGTTADGCDNTASVTVTVLTPPVPDAGPDQSGCAGETFTIGADPIYNIGGTVYSWSNGDNGTIKLSGGQQDHGTTDVTPASTTTYTVTITDANGCVGTDDVTITITPPVTPTFDAIPDLCQNTSAPVLPTTSNNGITGTWNSTISTSSLGTTTYTFTPNVTCALQTTLDVTVITPPVPTFPAQGPYCLNDAGSIPTTSNEGITGTWSPAFSTSSAGTTTYTFTPAAGQCSQQTTMDITVNPAPIPDAGSDQAGCAGDVFTIGADPIYNVAGTDYSWTSGANGTLTLSGGGQDHGTTDVTPASTTTYTVTLTDADGCQGSDDVIITITAPITPTFNQIADLCVGDVAPVLPTTSTNGISGVWTSTISTAMAGTNTYNFIPDAGECAVNTSMNITINPIYNLTEDVTVCENDSYTYPDGTSATITASTSYTSNSTTVAGCDSIIVTNVTMTPVYNITEDIDACENSTVTYPDGTSATITASTSYTSNLTTVAGCDSIIVTNVTMTPIYNNTVDADICSGADYTFPDGTTHTNITADESYTSNLTSVAGCDSIIVTNLTINSVFTTTENITQCTGLDYTFPDGTTHTNITASESYVSTLPSALGCDSIVTTNLTITPEYNLTEDVTVCENDSYTYPDGTSVTITASTSYTSNLTTVAGCDSIIVTNVTMAPVYNFTEDIDACENSTVTYPDGTTETITSNSVHTSALTTVAGCDSIIVTNVTMTPIYNSTVDADICSGADYTFPDGTTHTNITADESYTSNLTSVAGCDSIIVTNLTINSVFTTTENITQCTGLDYTFPDGTTHTNITASESYVSTLPSALGCDSIVTTNLTITPDYNLTEDVTVCENDSYTYPDGTSATITASTSYTSNLTTVAGCDSIIVTNVTMAPVYNITEDIDACENSTVTYPDGTTETITSNSVHTSALTTVAGCDSIIVTNVNMVTSYTVTEDVSICTGSSYTYPDGTTNTNITVNESHTSSLVSSIGCDSVVITNVTVNSAFNTTESASICSGSDYTYPDGTTHTNITINESYTSNLSSIEGCDSIVVTNLTVNSVYNLTESITVCENESVTYPDGFTESITSSTSHTSTLVSMDGCDSIIVTNVTMNPIYSINETIDICSGAEYTFPDGTTHTNITANESYTSNLLTLAGCDSVIVTTVNVNQNPTVTMSMTAVLCNGDGTATADVTSPGTFDFLWSNAQTASGTNTTITNLTQGWYYVTTTDQTTGCNAYDSVEVISSPVTITISIDNNTGTCAGLANGSITASATNGTAPYDFVWSTSQTDIDVMSSTASNLNSGGYTLTVTDDLGCTSTANITVIEYPVYNEVESVTTCENETVIYPDGTSEVVVANTSHTNSLVSINGCDSIIVTNVIVNPVYNLSDNITACENSSVTYPDGTTEVITTSTAHTSNLTTVEGCDSIIVTNVTMNSVYTTNESITACENSMVTYPDGTSESITGNTSHTSNLTSVSGCDSTVITTVTMTPVYNVTESYQICSGSDYTYPDGITHTNITADESYTSVLSSIDGCDSTIVTSIEVLPVYNLIESITVCANETVLYPDGSSEVVTSNTTHTSILTTVAGCDSIIVTTVNVNDVYNLVETVQICENATVTYPDGVSEAVTSNMTHTSNLTSIAGCDSIITTNVIMNPIYNVSETVYVCDNNSVTYPDGTSEVITSNTAHTSLLNSAAGCDSIVVTNVVVSYNYDLAEAYNVCVGEDITYPDGTTTTNIQGDEVHISNMQTIAGCDSIITTTVTVNPLPTIDAGEDQVLCVTQLTVLQATSSASTVSWSNGAQNGVPFQHPVGSATYTATATDEIGCSASDDVTITVYDLPSNTFIADVTSGCEPLEVTFTNLTQNTIGDCMWDFGNGQTAVECGSVTVTYPNLGYFNVTLTTSNVACTNTTTYENFIYVEDTPNASFYAEESTVSIFDPYFEFQNTSSGAIDYAWDFGDTTVSYEVNPTHTYDAYPSTYPVELVAYSELGCTDTAVVWVEVKDELIFYVPNTFTPDDDPNNSTWKPVFYSGYYSTDFEILVFNRWGEVVWNNQDIDASWDGTYNGVPVQDGTYVWKMRLKTNDGDERKTYTGHVNVLR